MKVSCEIFSLLNVVVYEIFKVNGGSDQMQSVNSQTCEKQSLIDRSQMNIGFVYQLGQKQQ